MLSCTKETMFVCKYIRAIMSNEHWQGFKGINVYHIYMNNYIHDTIVEQNNINRNQNLQATIQAR